MAALVAFSPVAAAAMDKETPKKENKMTTTMTQSDTASNTAADAIRPFQVHIPQAALDDLRQRIASTRWPDKETVNDRSQGAPLADLQELVRYWGTDYDWRKAEAKLNALPQFMTNIDGLDIHFIHVKSRYPNAMPLIITHGWPGSIFEQIKLIGPLTDPTAFGGRAEDAFDVVIPSLPGYGFSARPTEGGWGPERIGRAWDVLMKRLGYTHYVAQGGDWGAVIVQAMGRQAPAGLLGIHTNFPATIPNEVGAALAGGGPAPAGLSEKERAVFDALRTLGRQGDLAYSTMMGARPQAVGYGVTDSPAGLAGWLLVHPGFAEWTFGKNPKQSPTKDEVLDDFTLYWLTNSAASSARIYWENHGRNLVSAAAQKTDEISVPVAVSVFPEEIYRAPETWARRAFRNLIYFHEADRGGHFAAWEYPELFAAELRAAFKSLRSNAAPVAFKTADVANLRVFYREAGNPSKPTIVLLHGFPSSSHQFHDLIPLLADRFHVIAPDYPGMGFSEAPDPTVLRPTFDDMAMVIDAFIAQRVSGPVILYLHDIGGTIGMLIATAHPERIAGLIFQNFTISIEGWNPERLKVYERLGGLETPEKLAETEQFATVERDMFLHKKGALWPDALNPDNWAVDAYAFSIAANRVFMSRLFMNLTTTIPHYPQWTAYLKDRQPKTLIVWGRNDPIILPAAAEFVKQVVPAADLRYFDASHFALDENADEIAEAIIETFSR
jgi:pimeloyl-ACP methyl ester carboxylesterase